MPNKILYLIALMVVCIVGVGGKVILDQRSHIQSLTEETANVSVSVPAAKQSAVRSSDNPEVLKNLKAIHGLLASMDDRIKALEQTNDIKQVDETEPDRPSSPDDQSDDDGFSARSIAEQAARQRYYDDLEQTITQTADESFTQEVHASFEDLVTSRDEWANKTFVKSANCGGEFCKVVLNYQQDMDPVAQFEFDAMVFMWNPQLPGSTARYQSNADGTTDMIVYFAKKDSQLPIVP